MRLSTQLFTDRYEVPHDWQKLLTYQLLERTGFVHFPYSGFPMFLPIGKCVIDKISNVIRQECTRAGFDEIYLPLVQERRLLEKTGRATPFASEFFCLNGKLGRLIMCPTNEELFLELAYNSALSYRQLPVMWFQIADKFRNIVKPKGILRSKQFLMVDMVSIDPSAESRAQSARRFEGSVQAVLSRLGVPVLRAEKDGGGYIDYLVPCEEGETGIVISGDSARHANESDANHVASSSIAMYFLYDRAEAKVTYKDAADQATPVYLGTYGYGIQRCLHAVAHVHRDEFGIAFPKSVRPFDVSIIVLHPEVEAQRVLAEQCYAELQEQSSLTVLLDDRKGKLLSAKAALSDFYGTPYKVIIGAKEAENGLLMVKPRGAQNSFQIEQAELWQRLSELNLKG